MPDIGLIEAFMRLTSIHRPSRGEGAFAEAAAAAFAEAGIALADDGSAGAVGGEAGNLYGLVKGTAGAPPIMLVAHMDTVAPGKGIRPREEGGYIVSSGDTVLGADDCAGVVAILGGVGDSIRSGGPGGDVHILLTVAEEIGLMGAKAYRHRGAPPQYCFVLDGGGPIGDVFVKAPYQATLDVTITGVAAHAGIEPEKGVNAVSVAAEAVSGMRLGRIDPETTANIGTIKGEGAANIVCGQVSMECEARSAVKAKLDGQVAHMEGRFRDAAARAGASAEIKTCMEYEGFEVGAEDPIIRLLEKAFGRMGLAARLKATGGGSDTNVFNASGMRSVNLGLGMEKVHTVGERIRRDDIAKASEMVRRIVEAAAD
ncbi:MAG: M20/M25/M40 family metallo-hydrolase [Oscillospiraceae bacterium]|nr:M20/M25/M40 family metallo-hydrolase [Oscillospiraceae bacterium]